MTPLHFTWTDAGAVAVIFYIVIKILQEVRNLIETRLNGKTIPPLTEHCRKCHTLLNSIKDYQASLDRYLPKSIEKKFDITITNQSKMMICQKDILGKVEKNSRKIDLLEEHCEGRYKGTLRSIKTVLAEIAKHKDSTIVANEILRVIKSHDDDTKDAISIIKDRKEKDLKGI